MNKHINIGWLGCERIEVLPSDIPMTVSVSFGPLPEAKVVLEIPGIWEFRHVQRESCEDTITVQPIGKEEHEGE